MAQHPPFQGHQQVEFQARGWSQSPTTYGDVPVGTDAHLRTLKDLVSSVQMQQADTKARMVAATGSDSRTGEQARYYFATLSEAGVMDFLPHEFDDQATFMLWIEEVATPAFSHLAQFTPSGKKSTSRRLCQDLMGTLSKWMKAHGVSTNATTFFDEFRQSLLWTVLGAKAAPTTKARKQSGELVVSDALKAAVKARLDDLLTNPDADPLFHEFDVRKDGSRKELMADAIRALNAAYYLALNTTSRTGEIANMTVGDVDFENGLIWTTVAKATSGAVGSRLKEDMWPETREACMAYIEGRRTARLRAPEASLFSQLPVKWRSLMKDVMGDAWTTGLGLHKFSRNAGVQTVLDAGGDMKHMMATASITATTAQTYIDGANLDAAKTEANAMKRKAFEAQGLLREQIAAVKNSISDLVRSVMLQDAVDFAAMTGERIPVDHFVNNAAVFEATRQPDGTIMSKRLAPRGRFELPRDGPT